MPLATVSPLYADPGKNMPTADLSNLGFNSLKNIYAQLPASTLYEQAIKRQEAEITADGALSARTGKQTGRSPLDRFVVRDDITEKTVDWGRVNQPVTPEIFDRMQEKMIAFANDKDVFVQDLFCGADEKYRLPVRFVTQYAWHSLFVRNMFIRPTVEQLTDHRPAFTVINFPDCVADTSDSLHSKTFILVNFTKKLILIGGTAYAGEMKKAIFSIMNYILPEKGVMPMHASANIGDKGDIAVFFGLSGTGKTSLSADPERTLIGDDEHGWADDSVFNFEGGCYAKAIRLSQQQEPDIYHASRQFGTVLENVVLNEDRTPDFDNAAYAENSRSCYPVNFIPNASLDGIGKGTPKNIIMLTCDAFGVLPPVSKLTPEQAMYHFLSGYTARVAGTENGVTEPQATFSACFGAPFMPRQPGVYAELLGRKIAQHNVQCWLVNTGWTGGAYGTGQRMPINVTRTIIRAILDGSIEKSAFTIDDYFGLSIPEQLGDIPEKLLRPLQNWQDKKAYAMQANHVANLFQENFVKFNDQVSESVRAASIRLKG